MAALKTWAEARYKALILAVPGLIAWLVLAPQDGVTTDEWRALGLIALAVLGVHTVPNKPKAVG